MDFFMSFYSLALLLLWVRISWTVTEWVPHWILRYALTTVTHYKMKMYKQWGVLMSIQQCIILEIPDTLSQ